MRKLFAGVLLVMFLMPVAIPPVFAAKELQAGVTDAGNKLCPISGEPVSGTSYVDYQGKRYGLCCPGCDKIFLSDPAKYLAKMKAQEAAPAQESEHQHNMM